MKKSKLFFVGVAITTFNFQIFIFNAQAQKQECFSRTNFPVGGAPISIVSADFNHDNIADLAVANHDSRNISVLLGNGRGGFSAATDFTVGGNPVSITSADFNGDGKTDLATANNLSKNVSVLLGDGLGGFAAATNFVAGNSPFSIVSADFNSDLKSDLIVVDNSDNILVFLGDGLGGFGSPSEFSVGYTCCPYPGGAYTDIISADINGDSKADIVVTSPNGCNVWVFLGNGLGGFGAATSFAVGANPRSVISADFNGDGKIDLATANRSSLNVSILLGDGLGNFGATTNFTINCGILSLVSGDYNGDGKVDLAVGNEGGEYIMVSLGNGLGNFGPATEFARSDGPSYSILSADFNSDTKPDLAVTNWNSNNVSVFLNTTLTDSVTANASATTVCAGASVILTGSGATTYSWTGGVTNGVVFAAPSSTTTYTVTETTTGCSYKATKTITVNPLPTATFTIQNESFKLYCDGSIKANLTGGTGTIQPQWLDTSQTILSSTDSIGTLCSGAYTLKLSDSNSCTNTYTKTIQSGPIPPTPPICLVTVDSTLTHNLVVWEKTNLDMTAIDSFVVYREVSTNIYHRIGAVVQDSLSTFDDFIANPATTGYRYKLKSKNAQGVLSLFSDYHNTVYLTNTGGNFSWTPYQIENNTTPVSNYNVYRDDNSTGNFQTIGNTTGNQFGYTDINFTSFPNASYYVEAVMAGGVCHPFRSGYAASRSNVKNFGTTGIKQFNNNATINIYPNPADNTLTIMGIADKTTLRIYDIVNKLVIEKEVVNNTTIDTSRLAEGVYTLLMVSKKGRTFNKVVISH